MVEQETINDSEFLLTDMVPGNAGTVNIGRKDHSKKAWMGTPST